MKKTYRFLAVLLLITAVFAVSGCSTFKAPPSLKAKEEINVFATYNNPLNNYGFEPVQLVLNSDNSGYFEFYIRNSTVEQKKNSIDTAIKEINKKAYSEGDYQAGYRLVYVQDKNITQQGSDVSVLVEFTDINHFNTDIKVKSLEDYLSENSSDPLNNSFIDAKTREKSSIVTIGDKEPYKMLILKGVSNQIPVKLNGSTITAFYVENSSDVVELGKDTIKTTTSDYKVLYRGEQFSKALLIIAICSACPLLRHLPSR